VITLPLLAEAAGIALVQVGGLELLRGEDALLVLEEFARRGGKVLGVEGFSRTNSGLRPEERLIADFSYGDSSGIDEARTFIMTAERDGAYLYDLTLA
jgi:hypothetical protein